MFKFIDESKLLIKIVQKLSTVLAKQRGLPITIGIVFIVAGFVLEVINLSANSPTVSLVQVFMHNLGLIIALVGILMSEPLGQ